MRNERQLDGARNVRQSSYSATLQHDAERIGRGNSSDAIRGCEFILYKSKLGLFLRYVNYVRGLNYVLKMGGGGSFRESTDSLVFFFINTPYLHLYLTKRNDYLKVLCTCMLSGEY